MTNRMSSQPFHISKGVLKRSHKVGLWGKIARAYLAEDLALGLQLLLFSKVRKLKRCYREREREK